MPVTKKPKTVKGTEPRQDTNGTAAKGPKAPEVTETKKPKLSKEQRDKRYKRQMKDFEANPAINKQEKNRLSALQRRLAKSNLTKSQQTTKYDYTKNLLASTSSKERSRENKQGMTLNEKNRLRGSILTGQARKDLRERLQNTTVKQRRRQASNQNAKPTQTFSAIQRRLNNKKPLVNK